PPQLPNVLSEGVYAVILIAALRLMPDGIVGLSSRLTRRVASRFAAHGRTRTPPGAGAVSAPAPGVLAASSTPGAPDAVLPGTRASNGPGTS
ncbi:MAG: hypothetical protein ACYDBS_01360, partial [Acidimicrobiales bacterium]